MITFLIILAGLVAFNFILLKISTKSIDNDSKNLKTKKVEIDSVSDKSKTSKVPNAA